MGMSDIERKALKRGAAAVEPIALPILAAVAISGLSRSAIYREAGAGRIKLMKLGRTTLVDMGSVRALLASLPVANIRAPKQAA
jgi:hypothetical protein